MNPELKVGDKIRLYHMEGESQVLPNMVGVVTMVRPHPDSENEKIYDVKWEDGNFLGLISDLDFWKKVKEDKDIENNQNDIMMTEDESKEKKSNLNSELGIGDRIKLMHMEGEGDLTPGTTGEVTDITPDPFEDGQHIISVKWDNGSSLSLLTGVDFWRKLKSEIKESTDADFMMQNPRFFKLFKWGWWYNYLNKVRESGIVNMLTAAPLTYCGRNHLDRYYGENPPNEEAFSELLEMAEDAKNKMISACVQDLENRDKEITEESVNSCARKLSRQLIEFYVSFKMSR